MSLSFNSTIVTIADRRYFIPVFILVLSIKFYKIRSYIKILGVDLTDQEKELLTQFENVEVFDAKPDNKRGAFCRKGEAMLLGENDNVETITLLDGDCIVTGDITQYLTQNISGLSTRHKSKKEDGEIFAHHKCYENEEEYGYIPSSILNIWSEDVGGNTKSRLKNTVASGNLTINMKHLDFVKCWEMQIAKVLPNEQEKIAHNYSSVAYFQTDEHVLNSLLAFKEDVPPLTQGILDSNPGAYVAHLGPSCYPRYWIFWRLNRLRYYRPVINLIDWAKQESYQCPKLTWALNKKYRSIVYTAAYLYEGVILFKKLTKVVITGISKRL